MENAARHAASTVTIPVARDGDRVQSAIRDDGPGAPPETLARLVERGTRFDTRADGAGLGLAIAADIAEAVGGALTLANRDPGFEARLSLLRAPPAE
jgi:signal transduction histidine kinase